MLHAAFLSCSACCSALLMLFCLRAMCKLGRLQLFYLLCILLCNASALLPACYVQTRPAAAPIFAKFGSAFSGFYLPAVSKLSMLDLPGLSANCRLNRQIKMYRLRQSEMYHPEKSKVGHFALFFSSA